MLILVKTAQVPKFDWIILLSLCVAYLLRYLRPFKLFAVKIGAEKLVCTADARLDSYIEREWTLCGSARPCQARHPVKDGLVESWWGSLAQVLGTKRATIAIVPTMMRDKCQHWVCTTTTIVTTPSMLILQCITTTWNLAQSRLPNVHNDSCPQTERALQSVIRLMLASVQSPVCSLQLVPQSRPLLLPSCSRTQQLQLVLLLCRLL